jgi:hypothetical protein
LGGIVGGKWYVQGHLILYMLTEKSIGTHPELLYLQNELERRKDKRLELAARKRTYEFSHVSRKRKLEEDATWSWWKVCVRY